MRGQNDGVGSHKAAKAIAVVFSAIYIGVVMRIPIAIFAGAGHDDAFFMTAASRLLAFRWFGAYSQMTLIKGETYSFFLFLNGITGLPITLTTGAFLAFASVFFSWALYRIHRRSWLFALILFLTLFNPALLPGRIIRDSIYAPETLILYACVIQMLFLAQTVRARTQWGLAAGVSLAAFWYTREEGVWIIPALAILIVFQLWRDRSRWRGIWVGIVTATALLMAVSAINYGVYGTFVLVEFTAKPFSSALNALQSVEVGDPVGKVPVPRKVREELYKQSPAFAELQPFFDHEGLKWTKPGCDVYPETCGDYAGGWFMWALRDAVAWAGHSKTAPDAKAYYSRLTDEIKLACDEGRLACHSSIIPFLPRIPSSALQQLPGYLSRMRDLLLFPGDYSLPASSGNPGFLHDDERLLGNPLRFSSEEEKFVSLVGWYYDPQGSWLQISCGDGGEAQLIRVGRQDSPDMAAHFHDPKAVANRFRFELRAPIDQCRLQLQGTSDSAGGLPMAQLRSGAAVLPEVPSASLWFDSVRSLNDVSEWTRLGIVIENYRRGFDVALDGLLILSVGALLALGLLRKRRSGVDLDILILVLSFSVAVVTRLAVLLMVEISAFPALFPLYASAIFPLFATLAVLPLAFLRRTKGEG